jgi:3'(2'), 5'-bisphosphate nucleotidase
MTDLLDDARLARDLATQAGRLLLTVGAELAFASPATRGEQGDRRAHGHIAATLARERPRDAVLSEEGVDDLTRLSADRVWIVDPLDGTREFGEAGRVDWAVHVALWQAGELVAGAVALPAQTRTFSTAEPVEPPPTGGALRLVVSRSRPAPLVARVAQRLGADLVPLGSAGAKAMSVLQGQSDAYVHSGGMYEWDSAAPVAVAMASGLHASRTDGSPLVYNQRDPYLPDLVICRPELADLLLTAIADVSR